MTKRAGRPAEIRWHCCGVFMVAALALTLTACGGGSDNTAVGGSGGANNSGNNVTGVFAGFKGDLNWFNGGLGDGVGEGADGDGGVGVGGALGQFRNATVSASLEDGTSLGSAVVDASGLVTVRPGRDYTGALLIELRGGNGAEYFDEAKRAFVPFGANEVLRSRVPTVSRNIGVTPLTEAAARFMDANPNAGGSSLGQRIAESLRIVRDTTNQVVPGEFDIANISIVPTLLNATSGQGSAPDSDAGRYALLLAAAANLAQANNPDLTRPAASFSNQFAADMSDGVLDGVDSNGGQAASVEQSAYRHTDLARDFSQALDSAQESFGQQPAVASPPQPIQYGLFESDDILTGTTTFQTTLFDSGEVISQVRASDGTLGPASTIASGVVRLYSGVDNLATRKSLLTQAADGSIRGFGDNSDPAFRLGTEDLSSGNGQELPALAALRSVTFGSNHQVALDVRGEIVVWGDNSQGQLDGTDRESSATPFVLGGIGQPAFFVGATANVSLAAMQDGSVLSWGTDPEGGLGQGQLSDEFVQPGSVVTANGPLTDIVAFATCFRTVNALRRDGSVWAWGSNELGLLGTNGQARAVAAPIPGIPAMRKVVMAFDGAYGLARTGDVWYWGLNANRGVQLPMQVNGLANIRDLQTTGLNGVIAENNAGGLTKLAFGFVDR